MIPSLHIHLLGDFLLMSGDTPVTTVTVPRVQSLLAYLVLHRAAPQNRSHVAYLLWPDSTESQAHTNLRQLLYYLRQSLPNADQYISASKQSLQWLPTDANSTFTLDIQEFEEALTQTERAEQEQNTSAMRLALEQTTSLYRGDLLPSCYEEWILPERDRIRQLFFSAAERLITLLEQEQDYEAAIKAARQYLRHDPLHEASYRHLMRFYALHGDRAAALRVYHTCSTVMERELATEPGEATRQVYEALLQMDTASAQKPVPAPSGRVGTALIGRKQEWGQLQMAWRRAASGHPHMLVLSGEAGIGKTKLAEELIAWVSRQGMTTAIAHCYAIEGWLAYAPVTSWLRADAIQAGLSELDQIWLTEVARLVPALLTQHADLPHPRPMREGWQRLHFFEALARALLEAPQPLLLLLDDLQWCDNETLEWVHYLLRFEAKARLLLIGTMRAEETQLEDTVIAFLNTLQRNALVTQVALEPLNTTETASLAEQIMKRQLDSAMANMLYRETEGNPLFVVEMARAGTLTPHSAESGVEDTPHPSFIRPVSTLPPTIQTVLAARLAQLSPSARELAKLAAVIGRAFSFAVLVSASRVCEELVVRGLDELWQRRIVREQGMGDAETYEFSHDKLREQAYAMLSSVHRRMLHRRIAEALIEVYQDEVEVMSGQIALHYEHAGLPVQAISYYQQAGKVASRVYANEEAIAAFQRARTHLEASPAGSVRQEQQWQEVALLYEGMGDVFERVGQLQESRQAYRCALTHVPEQEHVWQARLQRKKASTWQEGPANPEGTSHVNAIEGYKEAERLLERASARMEEGWQQEWIHLQLAHLFPSRSSVEAMTSVIEKAQPVVEQYGTIEQRGRFYLAVCLRDIARNRYVISEQMVSYCHNALDVIRQTKDKSLIGFAQFALGLCLLWSGHLEEAEEEMYAAMRVGEQIGDATLLSRCLAFLPFIFRQKGLVEEVRRVITRASILPEARNIRIITGHRAWVAWRDGDLSEAEAYGRSLLEDRQSQQPVNTFYWTGLWPLIGVALAQEKLVEAMDYTRMLLEPTQQPLPEKLSALLEAALQAWEVGQKEETYSLLQQASSLAETMGYL